MLDHRWLFLLSPNEPDVGKGERAFKVLCPSGRALHPLQAEGGAASLPVILNLPLAAPTHADAGLVRRFRDASCNL